VRLINEWGSAPVKSRQLRERALRKPCSRFYYSGARNTVLHCSTMIKAQWPPIYTSYGNAFWVPHATSMQIKEKFYEETNRHYRARAFGERRHAGFRACNHV
jgi:hypothetical protein